MLKRLLLAALLLPGIANAQFNFVNGQVLTASQLTNAFAATLPLAGGTLTGPLTVPSLSVTGSPIPLASGGTGAATATGATSQLQYLQGATGSVARSLTFRLQDTISVFDFMTATQIMDALSGSPTIDETAHIQAAINALPSGGTLYFPAATYLYTSLTVSSAITLKGAGNYAAILKTSSLTGNTISFGVQGWHVKDLGFAATSNRTAGAYVWSNARYGSIENVSLTQYYIGFDIDGSVGVKISNINALDGTPAAVATGGSIIRLGNTAYTGSIGLRGITGDVTNPANQPSNGITLGYVDVVSMDDVLVIHHGNNLNVVPASGQTASLVEVVNSHFDTATRGMVISPATGGTATRFNFTNVWFGANSADGIQINGTSGTVQGIAFANAMFMNNSQIGANILGANVTGIYFENSFAAANGTNGLQVTSNAQNVIWSDGTLGATHGNSGNAGYGFSVDATGVSGAVRNANLEGNTTGRSSNPGALFITAGNTPYSWTSYTPTVTASSGTITTASATGSFQQTNKTVNFRLTATITTNGTGAASVLITLPLAAKGADVFVGREGGITGHALEAQAAASSAVINVYFYDGSYPGASGAILNISGSYETP